MITKRACLQESVVNKIYKREQTHLIPEDTLLERDYNAFLYVCFQLEATSEARAASEIQLERLTREKV